MEVFDDILIVEGFEGEAEKLQELLKEEYTLTVLNVAETEKFPKTLDEMQVIRSGGARQCLALGYACRI